jgi:hypothetical protein
VGGEGLDLPGGAGTPMMPGMPMAGLPSQPNSTRGDNERSDASSLLEGEGTEWASGQPCADSEATGQAMTGGAVLGDPIEQGTGGESEEHLPDDRVGVPQQAADEEDTAAWDAGGAMFTPLLWAVRRDNEEEIFEPGYSSEDRGTWGTVKPLETETETEAEAEAEARMVVTGAGEVVAPEAAAQEEPEPGPQWTTWQPNRAARTGLPGVGSLAPLSCGAMSEADEEEEEESEDTAEETTDDDASGTRGIADLLLQEEGAWGTVRKDRDPLI